MNLEVKKADTKKILCPQEGFFLDFMKICFVVTFKLTNSLALPSIHPFVPAKYLFKYFGKILHYSLNC